MLLSVDVLLDEVIPSVTVVTVDESPIDVEVDCSVIENGVVSSVCEVPVVGSAVDSNVEPAITQLD